MLTGAPHVMTKELARFFTQESRAHSKGPQAYGSINVPAVLPWLYKIDTDTSTIPELVGQNIAKQPLFYPRGFPKPHSFEEGLLLRWYRHCEYRLCQELY